MDPCTPEPDKRRRPSQCALHQEEDSPELYDCSTRIAELKRLAIENLPDRVTLHLPLDTDTSGRRDLERALPAIHFADIQFSRSRVSYYVDVETQDWLNLLFETLCVADVLELPTDYDWESRFDFVECPEPREYMGEIIRLARASNFTIIGLELEERAELVSTDYPRFKSIYGTIVETMKSINDALFDFLNRRIVIYDSGLDRELPLHPRVRKNLER
jgi:hypothetical protein